MKLDRDKLIRARELLGYGVEKTAKEAGVSKNSVLRAEHGEDIRPSTARKIAAALEVQVADLIGESETPLAEAPASLQLPLNGFANGFDEERRAEWDAAVSNAHKLREHGRARMEELLSAWRQSKERGQAADARRGLRADMGQLLQAAFDARSALLANLETGMAIPDPRLSAAQPGEEFPVPAWEEVREADKFYWTLREMVERFGLSIRTESAQEGEVAQAGQPESHTVEEPLAA